MPQAALTSLAGPFSSRPPRRIPPHARSPPPAGSAMADTWVVHRLNCTALPSNGEREQEHEQQTGESMRRLGIVAVLATLLMAFTASAALAVAPTEVIQTGGLHVCQGSALDIAAATTDEGKILTATGEVCGAGTTATATISANAEATVGCVTRGGGEPSGLEEVSTAVVASETFETRAGRGTVDVSTEGLTIEDFAFECPSRQQTEVLVGPVTFTDVTLTITSQTGTITATFPDIDP
jgi:hypothetical protein